MTVILKGVQVVHLLTESPEAEHKIAKNFLNRIIKSRSKPVRLSRN